MNGYQHGDELNGGAWTTISSNQAVVFVGSKSMGVQDWYNSQVMNVMSVLR